MKRLIILISAWVVLVGTAQASHRPDARVSFGLFYSSLTQYGEWIELDVGSYVWRPLHVRNGWRPYMHGRWVWTQHGWYWASREPFGWAVFHYGRWQYDGYYGWVWVPGFEWAPAWVEWRYNDDYIGWAPLPPHAHFTVNIGIHFTYNWIAPPHYWTFVGCRNFGRPDMARYVVPAERTNRFFGSTRSERRFDFEGGRIFNRGVDVEFVERQRGTRIRKLDLVDTGANEAESIGRRGDREEIRVFRPDRSEIQRSDDQIRRPEPRNIQQDEVPHHPQEKDATRFQRHDRPKADRSEPSRPSRERYAPNNDDRSDHENIQRRESRNRQEVEAPPHPQEIDSPRSERDARPKADRSEPSRPSRERYAPNNDDRSDRENIQRRDDEKRSDKRDNSDRGVARKRSENGGRQGPRR